MRKLLTSPRQPVGRQGGMGIAMDCSDKAILYSNKSNLMAGVNRAGDQDSYDETFTTNSLSTNHPAFWRYPIGQSHLS